MDNLTVLIADDHPVFRKGLRALLDTMPNTELVGEAASGEEAIMLAEKLSDTISGLAPLAPMDLPVWKSPNHKNAQR